MRECVGELLVTGEELWIKYSCTIVDALALVLARCGKALSKAGMSQAKKAVQLVRA